MKMKNFKLKLKEAAKTTAVITIGVIGFILECLEDPRLREMKKMNKSLDSISKSMENSKG